MMTLKELQERLQALGLSIGSVYFAPPGLAPSAWSGGWRADLYRLEHGFRVYACGGGPDLQSAVLDALERAERKWSHVPRS